MSDSFVIPAKAGIQGAPTPSRGPILDSGLRGNDGIRVSVVESEVPDPRLQGDCDPIHALIFDMDGTMVDSMPFHARAWAEFTRRHGIAMPVDEVLRRTTGRNGVECIRELCGQDTPQSRALELIAEKEAVYRELFAPHFREVPGFAAFAGQCLQRGLKLAVATAGDRHNIAFTLERLQLAAAPHAVIGGDEGLPGKPEPALFLEAAHRLGVPPRQCLVFEDAPFGIEAARRAGMQAVAICSTHAPHELAGPHVVATVRDFQELMDTNFLETLDA